MRADGYKWPTWIHWTPQNWEFQWSCWQSVHDWGSGWQCGPTGPFTTQFWVWNAVRYVHSSNFLKNVEFQNNSIVWDIFNQTREATGRSGIEISSEHRHLGAQIDPASHYAFHFSLWTEILNILRSGMSGWGLHGSAYLCLEVTHTGSKQQKLKTFSGRPLLFLLTVQHLISLPMLTEFLNLWVFMKESQLPAVEAKGPETHFPSPLCLMVLPRGLIRVVHGKYSARSCQPKPLQNSCSYNSDFIQPEHWFGFGRVLGY